MKKNKALKVVSTGLALSILFATSAFAGEWKQDSDKWKYQNEDGTFSTGWQWVDGKSYCFDSNGVMYTNTTTPDGYTVNENGAWIIDGVVQTSESSVASNSSSATNEQYPLAHLQKYFEVSAWTNKMDLKWNQMNVFFKYNIERPSDYVMEKAIENRDVYCLLSTMQSEALIAIMKLSGVSLAGYEQYVNDPKVLAIENEIRSFLGSFDWRNASDYEKAVAIAKRTNTAEYNNNGEYAHLPYGCLVEKQAACDGYTNTAELLGMCVELPVSSVELGFLNHAFPVYCINGVWFAHEPTSHDTYFELYDYHDALQAAGDYIIEIPFVVYCKGTGYEVPSTETAKSMFNGISQFVDSRGKLNLSFN